MVNFSERIGAVKANRNIQIDSINDELRNSLWNLFLDLYEHYDEKYWKKVAEYTAKFFRKVPADELPRRDHECRYWLKEYFNSLSWYQVYDFLEFIVRNHVAMTRENLGYSVGYTDHKVNKDKLIRWCNFILEMELSGYRFISGILSPISDKTEVAEIEAAINSAEKEGLCGASEHIKTAIDLLGKKPKPDFRNAIKEAISAVESVSKQIAGSNSKGLKGALSELCKHTEIHDALKLGFLKLYGYSSNEDGIRHAILDQPNVGFAEAKYMIVSCSAFVNFLIAKADSAGLLKNIGK